MSKMDAQRAGNGATDEEDQSQPKNGEPLNNGSVKCSEVVSSSEKEEIPLIKVKTEKDDNSGNLDNGGEGDDDDYMNDYPTADERRKLRKRKQDMNSRINSDYLEDLQRLGLTEEEFLSECFKTGGGNEQEESRSSSRKDGFSPLYKLNPDHFDHDPRKKVQIKRAIITYRHHELKKWTIISQREEIKKLRRHNNALMAKVMELRGCECERNRNVNIDVVDVVIPPAKFSEKMFPNVKWPDLEFENVSSLQPISLKKEPPSEKTKVETEAEKKPVESNPILVNIHSSRLGLTTHLTTSKKMEETTKTLPAAAAFPATPRKSISDIAKMFVKPKPSPSPINRGTGPGGVVNVKCRIPFTSVSPKKYDNKSPATSVPASKLSLLNPMNFPSTHPKFPKVKAPLSPTLRFMNSAKANSTVGNTDSVGRWKIKAAYRPILPKSDKTASVSVSALGSLNEEIRKREMEKLTLEQKFKMLDGDDEEEELAIIAALSTPPRQRKRKQAISQDRMYQEKKKVNIIDQLASQTKGEGDTDMSKIKVELEERYSDIIFEEAD